MSAESRRDWETRRYFTTTRQRPDRREFLDEWILRVVRGPVKEVLQSDGRNRRWALIAEAGGRVLRGVLLEDGETVHNAFSTGVSDHDGSLFRGHGYALHRASRW
jgi:hypothetical protein